MYQAASSGGSRISRWGGGGGAPTSDVGDFRWKRMSKQKNWVPLGGGARAGSACQIYQWPGNDIYDNVVNFVLVKTCCVE